MDARDSDLGPNPFPELLDQMHEQMRHRAAPPSSAVGRERASRQLHELTKGARHQTYYLIVLYAYACHRLIQNIIAQFRVTSLLLWQSKLDVIKKPQLFEHVSARQCIVELRLAAMEQIKAEYLRAPVLPTYLRELVRMLRKILGFVATGMPTVATRNRDAGKLHQKLEDLVDPLEEALDYARTIAPTANYDHLCTLVCTGEEALRSAAYDFQLSIGELNVALRTTSPRKLDIEREIRRDELLKWYRILRDVLPIPYAETILNSTP